MGHKLWNHANNTWFGKEHLILGFSDPPLVFALAVKVGAGTGNHHLRAWQTSSAMIQLRQKLAMRWGTEHYSAVSVQQMEKALSKVSDLGET